MTKRQARWLKRQIWASGVWCTIKKRKDVLGGYSFYVVFVLDSGYLGICEYPSEFPGNL